MALKITRRGGIIAGIIGGIVLAGGIAWAVLVLTTNIGGNAGYADASASDLITAVTGTNNSSVDCSSIQTDGNNIGINPTVKRLVGDGGQTEITPGTCTITVTIKNVGTVPLTVPTGGEFNVPAGWSYTSPAAQSVLQPQDSVTLTGTLSATANAVQGPVSGKILTSS